MSRDVRGLGHSDSHNGGEETALLRYVHCPVAVNKNPGNLQHRSIELRPCAHKWPVICYCVYIYDAMI